MSPVGPNSVKLNIKLVVGIKRYIPLTHATCVNVKRLSSQIRLNTKLVLYSSKLTTLNNLKTLMLSRHSQNLNVKCFSVIPKKPVLLSYSKSIGLDSAINVINMLRRKFLIFCRNYYGKLFVVSLLLGIVYFHGLLQPSSQDASLQARFEREKLLEIDKRQTLRRERLGTSCRNRSPKEIMPAGSEVNGLPRYAFSQLIVNDEHRFLYCDIPKVATSNWKRVFMTLSGRAKSPWDDIESRDAHNKSRGYFRYLNEYSASEIVVRLRTYYKFLFVRDPFERLTSAYRNKFVESYNMTYFERTYGRYIIRRFRRNDSESSRITFAEFVNYILEGEEDVMNTHWQMFDELCRPCLVWYDFIGYLEDIEQDSRDVLKILGISDRVMFPVNISSKYEVSSSVLMTKYFSKLSKSYKERLYDKYRYDFEMFGYPKPNWI